MFSSQSDSQVEGFINGAGEFQAFPKVPNKYLLVPKVGKISTDQRLLAMQKELSGAGFEHGVTFVFLANFWHVSVSRVRQLLSVAHERGLVEFERQTWSCPLGFRWLVRVYPVQAVETDIPENVRFKDSWETYRDMSPEDQSEVMRIFAKKLAVTLK